MPRTWDWVVVACAIGLVGVSLIGGAWILAAGSSSDAPTASPADVNSSKSASAENASTELFRLASHSRDVLVVVGATPGGPVEITAIPADSSVLPAGAVVAAVDDRIISLRSDCGWNCLRADVPVLDGSPVPVEVVVRRSGRPPDRVVIPIPATLPARGDGVLRAMRQRMAKIRTVRVRETLSSGQAGIRTRFAFQAPNRMSYRISNGAKAVVIGARRWDWDGGRWQTEATEPIRAPAYIWTGAANPWLLGSTVLRGEPVRVLSLFRDDPQYPAWFQLFVDAENRVLRADMLSVGHFMVDRFSGFDQPVAIEPPT